MRFIVRATHLSTSLFLTVETLMTDEVTVPCGPVVPAASAQRGESPAEMQMRMMRHVIDLHEENRALRDRVAELELQLHRERGKVRKLSRNW